MKNKVLTTSPETRVHLRAFRRLQQIDRELQAETYPNCSELAQVLGEVDRRTVLRDIAAMRDQFGAAIAYNAKRKGYYYKKPGYALPLENFAEGDLLAFFIAEYALRFVGDSIKIDSV